MVRLTLQEDIPDLDTSSETSTNYPSLNSEDFEGSWTEDSSIDPSTSQNSEEDSDEDVFFDARERRILAIFIKGFILLLKDKNQAHWLLSYGSKQSY